MTSGSPASPVSIVRRPPRLGSRQPTDGWPSNRLGSTTMGSPISPRVNNRKPYCTASSIRIAAHIWIGRKNDRKKWWVCPVYWRISRYAWWTLRGNRLRLLLETKTNQNAGSRESSSPLSCLPHIHPRAPPTVSRRRSRLPKNRHVIVRRNPRFVAEWVTH